MCFMYFSHTLDYPAFCLALTKPPNSFSTGAISGSSGFSSSLRVLSSYRTLRGD